MAISHRGVSNTESSFLYLFVQRQALKKPQEEASRLGKVVAQVQPHVLNVHQRRFPRRLLYVRIDEDVIPFRNLSEITIS